MDIAKARDLLQKFDFATLFIEELGWDHHDGKLTIAGDAGHAALNAVAHKRGMVAYVCPSSIPPYATRRKIEHQVTQSTHEHIIIYSDGQSEQIWQWVKREPGKPAVCREHHYDSRQPGDALLQKLEVISFSLAEEENLTLAHVTSRTRTAFDLDRVTKKFYDRFQKEHAAFLAFVQGIPDDAMQRWYVSVMLNRLMFIYFIQKKGFLDGDLQYLRSKLNESQKRGFDLFYREFLCPLFFEGFAKRSEERSAPAKQLLGNVPYLNGGIFQKHQIEEVHGQKLEIADAAFVRLFDFFEQYQWHLDEQPLHNDNEINPDVLGYIFEKYINQKQMGAYYTKEDITEYISKNTVLPRLFDMARQKYQAAFDGDNAIWQKLTTDPDRYIYDAVKHGTTLPLPPEIAAGVGDVAKRTGWNKAAPAEHALPTEIWREVVTRRNRYDEVKSKLSKGEIRDIADFITCNLDIRQFAQDVIETCEEPELLRAFWYAIVGRIPEKSNEKFEPGISILDPTCGSGAFLFAALNILEPLYEACLERMQAFIAEAGANSRRSKKCSDFGKILERVAAHPNRRYFILKTIIVNNLYGVDIMEEAIEICKLRLFLKLVAQVENADQIEPLPDIDFNIRAGNTLVGYASYGEVKRVVGNNLDFEDDMTRIQEKAEEVDRLFALFRRQQTTLGGEVRAEDKQELRKRLGELAAELDRYLAGEYGVKVEKSGDFAQWKASHKPFHWFIEFYGILKNGGFDVVIGNPPYVVYRLVKTIYQIQEQRYHSKEADNLYAFCMEKACALLQPSGCFGMIVPAGVLGLDDTISLREMLLKKFALNFCSTYAIRPSKLFNGVDQRLCIYLAKAAKEYNEKIFTTRYYHWNTEERAALFQILQYVPSYFDQLLKRVPKIGCQEAFEVLKKLEEKNSRNILHYYSEEQAGLKMHYHRSPRYWIRAMDFEQYFKSQTRNRSIHHFRDLNFVDPNCGKVIGSLLNSTLFFFWFVAFSNGRNITGVDVEQFPIGIFDKKNVQTLLPIFDRLMVNYQANSFTRVRQDCEFQEFRPSKSKPIIDEIDRVLAEHYGFSDEELDFIINYDIKYRMGRDADEEDV